MKHAFRQLTKISGLTATALLFFVLGASGCKVADDYQIADGAHTQSSYRTVAGAVHIGRNAAVNHIKTVAGEIHIGDAATTRSLSTVAGEVRIGQSVKVDGDVSTVAGDIRIDTDTRVTGSVSTVAGTIELNGCRIDGLVRINKGDLVLRGSTQLPGGLVVQHTDSANTEQVTHIDIGADAIVASIRVEPRTAVDLRISRTARVGTVTGATATYY